MRLYRGLNQIGMILLVLGLAWSAAFAGAAEAGYLESPLNDIIAQSAPDEKISAIIVMADRVDNERLNSSLKARKATFAQRHFEVITRLKQKAVLTQGPVIETLQQLQTQGAIDEYKSFWISNMISFKGTPEAIRQIAALAPVEKIIYDYPIEMIKPKIKEAETPIIATRSQGLDVISAPQVWAMGFTGYGRLVSNIDTGVDGTHPALSSRWRGNNGHPAAECWYDPVEGSTTPIDHGEGDVPHGTHTMGTICGRSTTTPDTVGVAINAQWIACASVDYGGSTSDIIASFQFIADPDDNPSTTDDVPDVVGNSWGYSPFFHSVAHCDNTFWSVMDGCENAGVVVIFSAGNEGDYYGDDTPNSLRTPADRATTYFNAFSVGAIYGYIGGYPIAEFSSRGPCDCASDNRRIKPECVAPGVNIRSCVPGGYESGWDGTSMASPHISGAVAILRQINPELTVDEIKNILIQSCVDLGPVGEDNTYGHGVLDLYQAAQMAIQGIGFIEGYARDLTYSTGLPATIYIPGTELSTVANGSGYYLLTVPGDTTYLVRATYEGYVPDEHSIAVTQGDTATQDFYLVPPIIDYSPASYNVSIPPGQSTARNLKIKNIGVGTIHFALYTETYSLLLNNGIKLPISIDEIKPLPLGYRPADETKAGSIAEPYYPPGITGQGGPDAFGYRWIDSDDPGGPSVSWVDISSQGTSVSLGEDNSVGPISMGFSFPYYGNNYSSLYIGSNGILTFGGGSGEWINDYIPDTADPDNLIAVWWDDLSPDDGGSVKYYYDSTNHRFIVSFIGVPNYRWPGGTGSLTFQAILYQSGNIEFNYGTMNPGSDDLQSATIGIENQSGSVGLQVVCNASYMHSNMSIRISAVPDWLSALPEFGSVAAGDSVMATVTFDATELAEGTYNGNINLDSNSPINNQVDIPATLNVTTTPVPSIELSVNAIYDTVYAGQSTIYGLFVSNAGNANLTYNTADDRAWISENPTGGTVLPSQSESVAVTFNATSLSPGNYTGTITVTSNDPVHPSINVPCYLFVDLLLTDDVGVSEILQPPDSMLTGTGYPLEVVVRNYGIEYKTFDVIFEAYPTGASTAVFSDTITVTGMAPAGTDTVTFADMFTPPVDTTYSLQAYTNLAGDQVPENNLAAKAGLSYTLIYFWYGNPGINPVTAPIGEPVNIDIFIRTPSTAFIADLHLCLGTDNEYIDSLLSESQGQLYYPLTEWDVAEFNEEQGSPPNRSGWSSQSFVGWARVLTGSEAPWLHFEVPTKIVTFAALVDNNPALIGHTEPAIDAGTNLYQGPSNAGDTTGDFVYRLTERFSELHFIESLANSVQIFYGDIEGTPLAAPVNGNLYIDTYMQTPEDGYIADMHVCLGAVNDYFDSLISHSAGAIYYPLTQWDLAEFSTPQGSPPNPSGWQSQSLVAWARVLPGSTAPWLHSAVPIKVMTFALKVADNPALIGDTVTAIGYGLNEYQGPSNAGDTSGDFTYYVIEYFSEVAFVESFACDFVPGDVNGDGDLLGSDVTYGVRFFTSNGLPPPDSCFNTSTLDWLYSAADANGTCEFIGSDITFLINYFRGTGASPTWCPQTPPLNPPPLIDDGLEQDLLVIPVE